MVALKAITFALAGLLPYVSAAPSPVQGRGEHGQPIAGKYIVTLKSGLPANEMESHIGWVSARLIGQNIAGVERVYNVQGQNGFRGYAGSFDEATVALIKQDSKVRF